MTVSLNHQPSTCNLHLEQELKAQHLDLASSQNKPVHNSLLTRNSPRYNTEKKTASSTSILIHWWGDDKELLESKTTTVFEQRTSLKEAQVQNVTLITSYTNTNIKLQLYYQSSPTTTGYRPVRPYLESEVLIRLAACFSVTTATLCMMHWIRLVNSRVENNSPKHVISPMCTAYSPLMTVSKHTNPDSNRYLTHIRNCIIYAIISELCMLYNHNCTVSSSLCTPQHSKYQKSGGSRKTSEHGRSMASPPLCGPATETPAPQDPVVKSINHALNNTTSGSLIDSHQAISSNCDKNYCFAYLLYTGNKCGRIPYLWDPDKVLAMGTIMTTLPYQKLGSEILHSEPFITTYPTISKIILHNRSHQSHLLFADLLDTSSPLLNFHCYHHDFNSATYIATAPDETNGPADGDGDKSGGNNSSRNQSKSDESTSRRRQITSRGALFNGSRHNTNNFSSNGDDGDGEDDNDKKGSRLLLQCQSSPVIELAEKDDEENEDIKVYTDGVYQPPGTKKEQAVTDLAPSSHQYAQVSANSTQINHNHAANHIFDMSVLQGISRISYSIWESAKNVSLFGRGPHNNGVNKYDDTSMCSDLSGLPDISEISMNMSINKTTAQEDDIPHSKSKILDDDNPENDDNRDELINKKEEFFTGLAKPEITPTPLALKLKAYKPYRSPQMYCRTRTRSECSPMMRTGLRPYDVPPSVLLKRKQRAELTTRVASVEETPVGAKRRTLSEPSSDAVSRLGETVCIRPRQTGLYDCSSGLGSYFHLDHNYLDKPDTGKIDREKLASELMRALSISGDELHSPETDSTVTLAWNQQEIDAVSTTRAYGLSAHHIDQRNCLMYLLGRIINNSVRILFNKPNFNGLKIIFLQERTDQKLPLDCSEDHNGQPIILLHLGNTPKSVNLIPKKFDPLRLNVYDVQLENCSLLTIFPETCRHMNISMAGGGTLTREISGTCTFY